MTAGRGFRGTAQQVVDAVGVRTGPIPMESGPGSLRPHTPGSRFDAMTPGSRAHCGTRGNDTSGSAPAWTSPAAKHFTVQFTRHAALVCRSSFICGSIPPCLRKLLVTDYNAVQSGLWRNWYTRRT